jgi:hypothetical protein
MEGPLPPPSFLEEAQFLEKQLVLGFGMGLPHKSWQSDKVSMLLAELDTSCVYDR